ncbi:MAG TPA: hypothetical protein ENI99_13645 [Sedimenticola sp.]|nr:hypothetical protein [Sedimenticola sp.]
MKIDGETGSTVIGIEGNAVNMQRIEETISGMGGPARSAVEISVSGESVNA